MTEQQKEVLRKIIYAVETGGQIYGQADYAAFTEAYTNSSAEHAITIGAGQWYGPEALRLLETIRQAGGGGFTQELLSAMQGSWDNFRISRSSGLARTITTVITTAIGKNCQDRLLDEQMETYVREAESLGVVDADAQAMCANFRHQGGYGAMKRVIGKTKRPYTLDHLYEATLSDIGNQVGAYRARQKMVYDSLKTYMTDDGIPFIWENHEETIAPAQKQGAAMETTYKNADEARNAVLALAEQEVGYLEKASGAGLYDKTANPGDNNYQKYGYELHNLQPSNMDYPAAWCDAFVDWLMYKCFGAAVARKVLCGDFDDYTVYSANYYKQQGRWTTIPAAGHQIFFQNYSGICHTGIVTKAADGYVYTIEGNSSNAVRRRQYSIGDGTIAGYGMPRYDLAAGTAVEIPQTQRETVRRGSRGGDVVELQERLNVWGKFGLEADGIFGPLTQDALIKFQSKNNLEADGIAGPLTWGKLCGIVQRITKTPGIIRKKASGKGDIVARLRAGDFIYIKGQSARWLKVVTGDRKKKGYLIKGRSA